MIELLWRGRRILAAGCAAAWVLGACGGAVPGPGTEPAVVSIEPATSDGGGGAPPPERVRPRGAAAAFQFPLRELFESTDAGEDALDELRLHLQGRRVAAGVTYEVELEVRGGAAIHRSSAKGESLSSVRAGWRTPSGVLDALRACARGAASCSAPPAGTSSEPWHEFEWTLVIEHPRFGRHVEGRAVALALAPLIEEAFTPGDASAP